MSSLTTLARPYAKAAFALARDEQALASWDDMLKLAGGMVTEKTVADLLESPHVSQAEVVKILADAAGSAFSTKFTDFLSVLASNGRLSLLPQATMLFREFRETEENRLSVKVVSVVPLDEGQASRLKQALARRFECDIELDNEIDKSVIGGAVVYAGDQVIDGSLRGKLEKLSATLAN
jgi:F-type H+-transporting ATPase subunit delta